MEITATPPQGPARSTPRCTGSVGAWLLCVGLMLSANSAPAKEYALIVGGGNSKWHNPVSLERQVQQAIKVLESRKLARIDVLFADGNDPQPDLLDETGEHKEGDADEPSPREKSLLRLYGHERFALQGQLRNHEVPHVSGAATKGNVEAWFREQGSRLEAGDKLLLYFATHGAPAASDKSEAKSKSQLLLWDGGRLGVDELGVLVEGLPAKVEVELVITACYGGGFAELAWPNQAPGEKAKTPHLVTGFFATAADRPASGCTNVAESPEDRPYATCFWSALSGKWPDGEKVTGVIDLNSDGEIGFGEAHAFALVNDTTLDTPLNGAEYALRVISRFGRVEETRLLTDDPYYEELRSAASIADQQLLDQLSAQVSLSGQRRLSQARTELRRLESELRTMAEERDQIAAKLEQRQAELIAALNAKSPALAQHSDRPEKALLSIRDLLKKEDEKEDETLLERKAMYNIALTRLRKEDQDRLVKEERWAKYQRFIQTAESVILAHNLPLVVEDKAILERFARLEEAENRP